ncbi:acylphosphatase-1 [Gastrophryne carolinensis]
MAEGAELISVNFEVFGKVQGVFFRKYTQAEGSRLGLAGWVQNTDAGTVRGQMQGPVAQVQQMQEWLQKTGSPKSKISRVRFHDKRDITQPEYSGFSIKK